MSYRSAMSAMLSDPLAHKRVNCCRNIGSLGLHAGMRKEHL